MLFFEYIGWKEFDGFLAKGVPPSQLCIFCLSYQPLAAQKHTVSYRFSKRMELIYKFWVCNLLASVFLSSKIPNGKNISLKWGGSLISHWWSAWCSSQCRQCLGFCRYIGILAPFKVPEFATKHHGKWAPRTSYK